MPFALSQRMSLPVKIYYEVHGKQDGPTIVFHHGNGNASSDWGPLGYIERLATDCQLVLIDMFGYGQSDKAIDPLAYDPQLRAADTIAVLDALHLKKNVIFFGGSMGGQLGFTLALHPEYHDRFKAFIINGATPYGTAELSPQFVKWLMPAKEQGIQYFIAALEKAMGKPFHPEIKKTFAQNDVNAMIASNTIPWPDYSAQLQKITAPFLLIVGENDQICKLVCDCHHALKNSILKIIPKKGHAEAYWDSSTVVPIIKNFMDLL